MARNSNNGGDSQGGAKKSTTDSPRRESTKESSVDFATNRDKKANTIVQSKPSPKPPRK